MDTSLICGDQCRNSYTKGRLLDLYEKTTEGSKSYSIPHDATKPSVPDGCRNVRDRDDQTEPKQIFQHSLGKLPENMRTITHDSTADDDMADAHFIPDGHGNQEYSLVDLATTASSVGACAILLNFDATSIEVKFCIEPPNDSTW